MLLFLFFNKTGLPAIFGLSMITFKHKIIAIWKLTNIWQLFPINVLVVRLHVGRRWSLLYIDVILPQNKALSNTYMRISKRSVYELWNWIAPEWWMHIREPSKVLWSGYGTRVTDKACKPIIFKHCLYHVAVTWNNLIHQIVKQMYRFDNHISCFLLLESLLFSFLQTSVY